jgi:two-component system, NarL family, sensor histidine kinase DevS
LTDTPQSERLRLLVDAGISLSSELSLDALLQRIVDVAAHLTGARYAALGVVDPSGMQLERFLTTGLSPAERAAIGNEPVGRGVLGVLIHDARPLRLANVADDPRSVGFPADHPPMHTFLGVPVLLRGRAYGNLYLTEKAGGGTFTEEDEELTRLLAAQAAVAVENARLHESSTRWLRQLESLNEIGNALAGQIELDPLLGIVAARLRELVRARLVLVALLEGESSLRIAAAEGEGSAALIDQRLGVEGSKMGRVLGRGRSERVDALGADPEVDRSVIAETGFATGLYVPLVVEGRPIGVIAAHERDGPDPRFGEDDLRIAESLAQRAAIGVDLSRRVSSNAVRRVVEAQELERARLARELHDETGQALTSILLGLRTLEQTVKSEDERAAIGSVRDLVVSTLHDVRRLAVELRPAALDDFGLAPAIERLVDTHRQDDSVDIDLETHLGDDRLPADVETTMYRIVQEALTNVAKHANAGKVSVLVRRTDRAAVLVVEDDGAGFDASDETFGLGVMGMRERVALIGGRLKVETGRGSGTTIAAEIPLT